MAGDRRAIWASLAVQMWIDWGFSVSPGRWRGSRIGYFQQNAVILLSAVFTEAKWRLLSQCFSLCRGGKNSVANDHCPFLPPAQNMSDPTLCRGKDADGNQCICMRCDETYKEDGTNRSLCKSCDHIASAHPEPKPSVGAFVRGFREAARLGSGSGTAKASKEEAEAETSAGLRTKKRKSDTDTEPASKKAKGKGKEVRGEKVKYGKLVFLTCGISNGALENPKIPSAHQLEAMRAAGLVRLTNPKKPLLIDTNWGNKEANAHVKELVADAIAFLENQPYTGNPNDSLPVKKQLWMGCVKQGKSLIVAGDPLPTGVELADHCKAAASKAKIAERHWKWNASDSEDLGSDVDPGPSEDIIMTPRKPAPKKQPKIKLEPSVSSEDESDMRKAAKMRTRISTGTELKPQLFAFHAYFIPGTFKRNSLFIPGSSDGLEDPQDGPSGLTNEDIVIVSDDDDDPPLAPTLASVFGTRSPSPVPSFEPLSPNEDPPTIFDDLDFDPLPLDNIASGSSLASSSSLPSATTSVSSSFGGGGGLFAPTWATPNWSTITADTGGKSSSLPLPLPKLRPMWRQSHASGRWAKVGRIAISPPTLEHPSARKFWILSIYPPSFVDFFGLV
ncbi:hypothetical protein B0H13DRAFT_1861865 [Mycena leptocephala]|nr:hypothetical protein B0H13DRAFT_1861865 [Mycena leptocephala]